MALRLTVAARREVAAALEQAERGDGSGNARLAVRLLNDARVVQACRVVRGPAADRDLVALVTSPRTTSRIACFPTRSTATMTVATRTYELRRPRRTSAGSR